MKQSVFTLERTRRLAGDVWELVLSGDTSAVTAPGQFVNIALPGKFLRRPISVCDWAEERLTLLVKEAGEGTKELVRLPAGTRLDALSGLGNGFDPAAAPEGAVLVGGGIGVAPLFGLAMRMREAGRAVTAVLGYRTGADIFLADDLRYLGVDVRLTTEDGSAGVRGMVTDAMTDLDYTYFYTCGPEAMFRAVNAAAKTSGQFSLEARMGCGYGACMGCTIETKNGPKRVCKDGPVFTREDLLW